MSTGSDLEKTETASATRIAKAYEDGDVPRSKDLVTLILLLVAGMGLWQMGSGLIDSLKYLMSSALRFDNRLAFDSRHALGKIFDQATDITFDFLPLMIFMIIAILISPLLTGGWNISTKALMPNLARLNPISGIGNIFTKNSLVELVKSIMKLLLIGVISYLAITHEIPNLIKLSNLPIETGLKDTGEFILHTFFLIILAYFIIVAIDLPYQLYRYAEKLKMSKVEVKQEMREGQGNPEIKGKIRQQQIAISRRRMMSQIQNADVVITNPTHYAVAIRYEENDMAAPIMLAKGTDAVALRIKEIAKQHQILEIESPKLARALFANTEINEEIPEALYLAVAEILAFVFQVRKFNGRDGAYPNEPLDIQVPDELDPHLNPEKSLIRSIH